ncbi:AraC family transcriptional regulator [Marinomonas sp. SBI22]|uniref:AraC family transcriptional regulator n=1 Tax=unclassified Marinomonas TaxID=196814 RepID=UPI0007AF19A7|nr:MULTISPECIES: AraC family transcriptional regulator [unclassified Marinomonas]KZM40448.1 AraC family transcriptional regulator [Marinomonas sp. SBI8L]KZM43539.1 AraC family transcriptional regulator [Marinomonas sp. SBI22]
MSKELIKQLVEMNVRDDGMVETGVKGVQLFRVTSPVRCAPAIYEPTVVALVNGSKEAIVNGQRYAYDSSQFMCCPISMPVEAGTPEASPENPLLGVYISLDTKVMTELAIEMDTGIGAIRQPQASRLSSSLTLSHWDEPFTEALVRLLRLLENPSDISILGEGRLRELYYAVLKGEAGVSARRAFGVGNDIARVIEYLTANLDKPINIEVMATQMGMSRAVLHRKFKQATMMSPIQFVKSMRLNTAAIKIVGGMNVNTAAMEVGYVSSSQFSREFKRMYGQSPKQWIHSRQTDTD